MTYDLEDHLKHAAGMAHLLDRYKVEVTQVKANENGALLLIEEALPEPLHEHIEAESESGVYIFGVWIKHQPKEH